MLDTPDKVRPCTEDAHGGNQSSKFADEYPLNILIADDNFVNKKLIEKILQKLGYQADTASDGIQVLNCLDKKNYDVILMDIRMPEMDGYEATMSIRHMNIEQPYIIAMTANVMPSDREQCLEIGMNEFIPKPINLNEVITKLRIAASFCANRNKGVFFLNPTESTPRY